MRYVPCSFYSLIVTEIHICGSGIEQKVSEEESGRHVLDQQYKELEEQFANM